MQLRLFLMLPLLVIFNLLNLCAHAYSFDNKNNEDNNKIQYQAITIQPLAQYTNINIFPDNRMKPALSLGFEYEQSSQQFFNAHWFVNINIAYVRSSSMFSDGKQIGFVASISPGVKFYLNLKDPYQGYHFSVAPILGYHTFKYLPTSSQEKGHATTLGLYATNYYSFKITDRSSFTPFLGAGFIQRNETVREDRGRGLTLSFSCGIGWKYRL